MSIKQFPTKFVLAFFLASQALFAQPLASVSRGQEGSGGIVVACFQNDADYTKVVEVIKENRKHNLRIDPLKGIDLNTVTVRLLDLYLKDGFLDDEAGYIEASPGETAIKILEDRIALISQHSNMGDRLNFLHQGQLNYNKWKKSPAGVAALDDTAAQINLDANCTFLTVAFQDRIANLTTIYFDPRLYNKLTTVEQAALFVHEYLYHDAKLQGMNDSRAVRLIVSNLFKKSFASSIADLNSFHSDLEAVKFLNLITPDLLDNFFSRFTYDYQGKTLKLENGEIADRHPAWGQVIASKSSFYINGVLQFGFLASAQDLNGLLFKANKRIEFYESGNLKSGTIEQDETTYQPTALKKGDEVEFFESGSLSKIEIPRDRTILGIPCGNERRKTSVYFYENKKFRACRLSKVFTFDGLEIADQLETYASGNIKKTRLYQKAKLFSVEVNEIREFEAGRLICFDESKRVVDCNTLDLITDPWW